MSLALGLPQEAVAAARVLPECEPLAIDVGEAAGEPFLMCATGGLDADATRAYLESDEDAERIRGEDAMARRMGVQGVPCFILNRKYAISGAQEPQVFLQAIAQIEAEAAQEPASAEAPEA